MSSVVRTEGSADNQPFSDPLSGLGPPPLIQPDGRPRVTRGLRASGAVYAPAIELYLHLCRISDTGTALGTLIGLFVFGLTLSAFLAPPFSGLDTLPSLGVVVIGLRRVAARRCDCGGRRRDQGCRHRDRTCARQSRRQRGTAGALTIGVFASHLA